MKLSKGLIAVGAEEKSASTSLLINLANKLAEKEKVLFINWTDFSEKLHQEIRKTNVVSKNLTIDTNIDYFGVKSFLDIIDLIESYQYSSIFIDDINYYVQADYDGYFGEEINNQAIRGLRYIVDKLSVRIVFNIRVSKQLDVTKKELILADFSWSRLIINDCDQVLALYNLKDEGNYENMQISNLKNDSCEVETSKLNLNSWLL